MKLSLPVKIVIAVVVCLVIGLSGSIATNTSLTTWFTTLNKPSWNPPNWLFAPVWTTLFILMGIAAGLIWHEGTDKGDTRAKPAMIWFGMQLILNLLWSFSFFGAQSLILGLVNILILWVAILITILKFRAIKPIAAWLMVPYILWVSFATVLNITFLYLN